MIVHSDQAKTLKNGPTGSVGSSLNVSYNTQKGMLIDINGDGLLDYLEYVEEKDCHFAVYYNTGSSLSGETNDNMSMSKWTEVTSEAEYELSTDF